MLIWSLHRSQFVQSLLLSTLSIADESDEQNDRKDDIDSHAEQISDATTNTVSPDSVTSNTPTARPGEYEGAKKKQESESHSDLDAHPPHLSGRHIEICLYSLMRDFNNLIMFF